MKIKLQEISVRELVADYQDEGEGGVTGYGGKLDIRPAFQREFIYKDKQRAAVIETVRKSFPLNVMYWAVQNDDEFEVIDGQQRTISICQYVEGDFAHNGRYFHNLQNDERDQILNYKLMIYMCDGSDSEKLEWFKTINIAGERLTDQELRNAVYSGSWVSDAKRYFSKTGCPAAGLGDRYMTGSPIRQDYLETAIKWINNGNIEDYMAKNQHKSNAGELWRYYQSVMSWIQSTFPVYRSEMRGIAWGNLYNLHKDKDLDATELEARIAQLMADEDVTKKSGIYAFLLDADDRHLNIRAFSDNQKREAYERQKGICVVCGNHFPIDGMHADHIKPWSKGGRTEALNCQMLCADDNRRKSAI